MGGVITGSKMLAHLDRIFGEQRPITADIFLNNYCNNDCPYCAYRRWELDAGARSMPFSDFVTYAKRMKELGVLGFILSGGGEPSIAKDFDKIIAWLDDNDYKWGINTNFNRYFYGKPEYLKVSLDAYDRDSYILNRGVDAYANVRDNIMRFAEAKDPKTKLGIQLLAKKPEHVFRFYDGNKDLPVDYMSIRPVESTSGRYYKENDNYQAVVDAIKQVQTIDDRVLMNYKWSMIGMQECKCIAQWSQIAVNEIGEVMYCCHKPYQIVGHIMDADILEKKRKADTDMVMCDIPCRLTAPNRTVSKILEHQTNAEFI